MSIKKVLCAAMLLASVSAGAKNADELRVYINPGHGSWTGNDRAMATIAHGPYNTENPDTTGFFESNTNLWKCFGILDKLVEYGLKFDRTLNQDNPNPARVGAALDMRNNIVMSHVKLGPYPVGTGNKEAYNRSLYEISCEVERGNFDFFLSVHSNAHTDGSNTNYPAMFVRGENKVAFTEGADDAARTMWPYAYQDEHACWSNYSMTSPGLYYDIDFWHGDHLISDIDGKKYKGYYGVLRHGVLGFLCEGYFHTYQPARHRAMNMDVCRHEGTGYAHGIAAILGLSTENYGELYGIVRDLHERFSHAYYKCSPNSPDAKKPINGATVKLYKDGVEIDSYTTDGEWNGAFLFPRLEPGQYTVSVTAPGYKPAHEDYCGPFTIEASKTTYPKIYLESESYVPPVKHYYDYPDEAAGCPGIFPAFSYAMKRNFTDKNLSSLKNKTVRRMICRGDKLYILVVDDAAAPTLLVVDANKLSVLRTIETAGCEGSEMALSDIQVTSDGVLIGCSMQQCTSGGDAECNVYRWQNDDDGLPTGAPKKWFATKLSGGHAKALTGRSMAYSGTFNDGRALVSAENAEGRGDLGFNIVQMADGKVASETAINNAAVCDFLNATTLGAYTLTVSPLASDRFIVNSPAVQPREYTVADVQLCSAFDDDFLPVTSSQAGFFRFAGRSMMVAPSTNAEGKNTGVRLVDISNGLDHARLVNTTNTGMTSVADASSAAAGRTDVVFNDEGEPVSASMVLFVVRGGKLSRFTTLNVEQPIVEPAYAYDLKSVQTADGGSDLIFKMTADAKGYVELLNVVDSSLHGNITLSQMEFKKGENTVHIESGFVRPNEYEWCVVVLNEAVNGVKKLYEEAIACNGVTVDNNWRSPFFGQTYVSLHGGNRGLKHYNPALESLNETPYQASGWDLSVGASCWRLATMTDGTLMIADWGDKQGGIYLYDPANPQAERKSLFAGTRDSATGEIRHNGVVIGGSTSGMWQHDAMLYTFQEDYPSSQSNRMVAYQLGNDKLIENPPFKEFPTLSPLMLNGNVNVVAHHKALFLSQTRGAGNNTPDVPVFIVADYEGKVLYNSGKQLSTLNGGDGALAVNADASMLAVVDATGNIYVMRMGFEPEFTLQTAFTFDLGTTASVYQMAFDNAGRLFVAARDSFKIFAVPQGESRATTYSTDFVQISSGLDDVEISDRAPVEIFNLQGVRMSSDNLPSGVYIRRQGSKVTKVIVR